MKYTMRIPNAVKSLSFSHSSLALASSSGSSISAATLSLPSQGSLTGKMRILTMTKNPIADMNVTVKASEYARMADPLGQ